MIHLDLFSGIGGFSIAVDTVWPNSKHVFVEIDPFCQAVLKKHWPEATIYGDIKTFTNTYRARGGTSANGDNKNGEAQDKRREEQSLDRVSRHGCTILTGGFPCQPFSAAGRRQGTDDDRYLWPEMFRVIREFQPDWVIAENVYGLVTWNEGMVLEQVCSDLESEDYEVQPFIIPAVSVNAPHRRDRVWIVANRTKQGRTRDGIERAGRSGLSGGVREDKTQDGTGEFPDWSKNWIEVATWYGRMDDGLPAELDKFKLSKSRHRKERLKSLGNAIVPQVATQILHKIKFIEDNV